MSLLGISDPWYIYNSQLLVPIFFITIDCYSKGQYKSRIIQIWFELISWHLDSIIFEIGFEIYFEFRFQFSFEIASSVSRSLSWQLSFPIIQVEILRKLSKGKNHSDDDKLRLKSTYFSEGLKTAIITDRQFFSSGVAMYQKLSTNQNYLFLQIGNLCWKKHSSYYLSLNKLFLM